MWMAAEMQLTIATMTALSVSRRSAQCTSRAPVEIQVAISTVRAWPATATSKKRTIPRMPLSTIAPQVTSCEPRSPRAARPKKPEMMAPSRGRKTIATAKSLALHQIDVFDRDGAAVAEIDDEDGKADRRLGRRHG